MNMAKIIQRAVRVVDKFRSDAALDQSRDSWFLVLFGALSQDMRSGSFPLFDKAVWRFDDHPLRNGSILQAQYVRECFNHILLMSEQSDNCKYLVYPRVQRRMAKVGCRSWWDSRQDWTHNFYHAIILSQSRQGLGG